MYLPFEIACVLVRDEKTHRDTFAHSASYIAGTNRGVIAGGLPFAELGIELTRSFKALKAWMSLKAYGIQTFVELIRQNVAQAQYLATIIKEQRKLELLAPVALNTVCFRYLDADLDEEALNRMNNEILQRVQESGVAIPSSTIFDGKFVLRVAIVNHRSKREAFELLIKIIKYGSIILQEWKNS